MLATHGRPLLCTEYMARPRNSRFANVLPLLKQYHVAAINWGLVEGKTNTKYAWDTPLPDGSEPTEWFHEIFRRDGAPYRPKEVELIKKLTGNQGNWCPRSPTPYPAGEGVGLGLHVA